MEEKSPGFISTLLSGFFAVISEMIGAFVEVAPKAISFSLWILVAVFVLPCVFVAGTLYPKWEKWGEDF